MVTICCLRRGEGSGTTFQLWDFPTAPPVGQPVAPDLLSNPYGTPHAIVASTVWDQGSNNHPGMIRVDPGSPIEFWIPNLDIPNPLKYIWVQVTYLPDPCTGLALDVQVTAPAQITKLPPDCIIMDQNWLHGLWRFELQPNPPHEQVFVVSLNAAAWVDQVAIDTWCVGDTVIPEWSSLALAAPAVLGLLAFRRRNS